jgi:hypothetical protein
MIGVRSMVAACMAAGILLTAPGCVFTQKVWTDGRLIEHPGVLEKAWLSDQGEVCLVYRATIDREVLVLKDGYFPGLLLVGCRTRRPVSGEGAFRRALVFSLQKVTEKRALRPPDLDRPVSLQQEGLAVRMLLHGLRRPEFSADRLDRLTEGWQELDVVHVNGHLSRTQSQDAALADGMVVQTDRAVGLPYVRGQHILVELPVRQSLGARTYPVRLLLTPPAIAADAAVVAMHLPLRLVAMFLSGGVSWAG